MSGWAELGRRARWSVAALQAVVVLCVVTHLASLVLREPGQVLVLVDAGLAHVLLALSAGLCLLRGVLVRVDRAAWLLMGAAGLSWTAGNVYWWVALRDVAEPPYPSWADAGWLAVYPLAYVGLVLLVRRSVVALQPSVWLDGVVGGLGAAAVSASLFLDAITTGTGGSVAEVATNLAYPVGDLLLLVLAVAAAALLNWRPGRAWGLLGAGFVLFAVADTVYLFQMANDTFVVGTLLDAGWTTAIALFGLAAWRAPCTGSAARLEGWRVLVMPLAFTLASLAVLFQATLAPAPLAATVLALGAVLAALARTGLTFREVRALAESRHQARTDDLTGLPNRRSVYEALAEVDASRTGAEQCAVLLVDLDRFKEINDSLGHAAGDALLRQVGPRLSAQLRYGDLLARLGGDEFVVLGRDLDVAGAAALAARLRRELQKPFTFGELGLTVDASVGVALGPDHAGTGEELLQLADLAMYSAKARRVGVAVYDDARDGQGRHRLETVEQLRNGIARGELVLHYQPKLALPSDWVTGVEALVRWQHPERGLLYPDAFIDLAESFGLMGELTVGVLDAALAQCRSWSDQGEQLSVAVNVSPSNLVDESFPEQVHELLARHGLAPAALVLEVTESLLMEDRERAVSVLGRLRAAGVGIAIDDYGTGYSSLAYLAELPVTELKLDRAFVAAMQDSPRSAAIVRSTLQLAHALGLVLVAEGAEDQNTVDALSALGCDLMQGYHLSRPLPPERLLPWLHDRRAALPAQRAAGAAR